ncbi:MAG: aminotransferase class V-fold PLP-dependent enzyme [Rubrivivax sp.]|nr:aminotransferase class V-fold PLP-dependent enzyme [Rubrivivax sp.]
MTHSPRIPGTRFLHSPGPTHLPDEVLDAMHRQPIDLMDPRLIDIVAACESGLQRLAGTAAGEVIMYAANGHGAWEVVIENLLPPDSSVLIPGTGHFSDSWALQCEALGRHTVRTPWREGHPIDPQDVEAALREDREHRIQAVFVVHTDTASSVTSDLDALRAAVDRSGHPALFVVDAVASLGAAPLAMDAQRIDLLVGASQKGLMLPPGIGFVIIGAAAAEAAKRNPAPRFYWDWGRRSGRMAYQKFCGTPPLNLLMGMRAGLDLLFQEGVDAVHARHRLLAAAVQAAVQAWSREGAVDFFCPTPAARSVSVTAIRTAAGIDPEAIRTLARERFQVAIAGGLGPLHGRVFRIGHLGDLNAAMILGALGGVEAAMLSLGVPFGRDGLQRAVDVLVAGCAS